MSNFSISEKSLSAAADSITQAMNDGRRVDANFIRGLLPGIDEGFAGALANAMEHVPNMPVGWIDNDEHEKLYNALTRIPSYLPHLKNLKYFLIQLGPCEVVNGKLQQIYQQYSSESCRANFDRESCYHLREEFSLLSYAGCWHDKSLVLRSALLNWLDDPAMFMYREALRRAYFMSGFYGLDTNSSIELALESGPSNNVQLDQYVANFLTNAGKSAETLPYWKTVEEHFGPSLASLVIAEIFIDLKKYDDALTRLDKIDLSMFDNLYPASAILEFKTRYAKACAQIAQALYEERNYSKAAEISEKAITVGKNVYAPRSIYYLYASSLEQLGKYPAAEEVWRAITSGQFGITTVPGEEKKVWDAFERVLRAQGKTAEADEAQRWGTQLLLQENSL
jgi:tetratricopeptide (TPR) repeat protein